METERGAQATRRQLLESACELFAEKGYRDASVAEICARAKANKAAVNYHFRSKEALYVEAWRLAFRRSLEKHPPDGGVPASAPAEERLRGQILSVLQRVADVDNREFEIVHKEMANPTGLLVEVMRESIEPLRLGFLAVVRELLGPRVPDIEAELCERSILAQCMHLMMPERHRKTAPATLKDHGPPPLEVSIEAIADHIARFSLAGIHEIRGDAESR